MTRMIPVSEEFYTLHTTHNRDDESMEETLRPLTGDPAPRELRDVIGKPGEPADDAMREAIERRRERGLHRRRDVRERPDE